jgi:uncharacterized protein
MTTLSDFRVEKDEFFARDSQSPLSSQQKTAFSGLFYFAENPALRMDVLVKPFSVQEEVQIQTNTGDIRYFRRFGQFEFNIEGQINSLTIYLNEYGYFMPFVDSLAGTETYPAGRYLEPEDLGDGRFLIDFNYAYNPYCAYNEIYSCPLTPAENHLKAPIRAGERIFPH